MSKPVAVTEMENSSSLTSCVSDPLPLQVLAMQSYFMEERLQWKL